MSGGGSMELPWLPFFLVSHASRKKGYWNIFDGSYCETCCLGTILKCVFNDFILDQSIRACLCSAHSYKPYLAEFHVMLEF